MRGLAHLHCLSSSLAGAQVRACHMRRSRHNIVIVPETVPNMLSSTRIRKELQVGVPAVWGGGGGGLEVALAPLLALHDKRQHKVQ